MLGSQLIQSEAVKPIYLTFAGTLSSSYFHIYLFIFIWLHHVLVAAYRLSRCGMCVVLVAPQHVGSYSPDQGSNLDPLHWKADS